MNCSPHTALKFKSTQEVWYDSSADYSNLRVFSCLVYIHVSKAKLEPITKKCIFIGYSLGVKGYRYWCEKSKKIKTFRDVVFENNALITPLVENSLTYIVGKSDYTQEVVEPPNVDENNDDVQYERQSHCPLLGKKKG